MKYWLIQIATEDGDMEEVQERLDTLWEVEGDEVLADKVVGVTYLATTDHRLIAGDKVPGTQHEYGKFTEGTVGSLIEALKAVDPTGEREVKFGHHTVGKVTNARVKPDGKVYLGNLQLPPPMPPRA